MFKNFATSSRHKKILRTLALHSHICRAKVRDKIRKTVARNSHASEILALALAEVARDGRWRCSARYVAAGESWGSTRTWP